MNKINKNNILINVGALVLAGAISTGISASTIESTHNHTSRTCFITNFLNNIGLDGNEHQIKKIFT